LDPLALYRLRGRLVHVHFEGVQRLRRKSAAGGDHLHRAVKFDEPAIPTMS
jgi:hypothetical protein